jgi:endonuclease/exonuclease/phosphatase family metal-dependent hydrolase
VPGPQLKVAFWNVQNLFEPNVVSRGPQSASELVEKIDRLAAVIKRFFGNAGPDLLSLGEVGSQRIHQEVAKKVFGAGNFLEVWAPPGLSTGSNAQTGIGLLGRTSRVAQLNIVDTQRPTTASRPRCIIVECDLVGVHERVLIVANHWKSRLPSFPIADGDDRLQTADWLGQRLASEQRTTSVIALGDFNAEPFEPPFGELRLRARRNFSSALWSNATPAYLYNTAWRFMTEPDLWEVASQPGYEEPRPKSSYGESGVNLLDHILVSGRVLKNGPLRLQESSVEFHVETGVNARHTRTGVLRPEKWKEAAPGDFHGCSDHFPILARFDVV